MTELLKHLLEFNSGGIFNHDWLDAPELEQINTPFGRFYNTPSGNKYKSVTTFLSQIDKEGAKAIRAWKDAVGEEEANLISNRATTRGSNLHEHIEEYLLNHTVNIDKRNLLAVNLFKGIKSHLGSINQIRLLEDKLYSDTLQLAGTVDCVANWEDTLSVIDFKTSNHRKAKEDIDNYFIQCTCYSLMVEELFDLKIDQLVILMAVEFETPVIHISSRKEWLKPLAIKLKELRS